MSVPLIPAPAPAPAPTPTPKTRSLKERISAYLGLNLLAANQRKRMAKNNIEAGARRQDAEAYDAIADFFKDKTAFTTVDFATAVTEPFYSHLSQDQKDRFNRLAQTRVAINELIDKDLGERDDSLDKTKAMNQQRIDQLKQEDDERIQHAQDLRLAVENYQEKIEDKIDDIKAHLIAKEYKEAFNASNEADRLLTSERGGMQQALKNMRAGMKKAWSGKETHTKSFSDAMMQRYHMEIQKLKRQSEAGLHEEGKKIAGQTASATAPIGTWEPIYKGNLIIAFKLPGEPYTLEVVERVKITKDDTIFIVRQSKAVGGQRRYAYTTDTGVIDAAKGFFFGYQLLPGKTMGTDGEFKGQIGYKEEKNKPFVYENINP